VVKLSAKGIKFWRRRLKRWRGWHDVYATLAGALDENSLAWEYDSTGEMRRQFVEDHTPRNSTRGGSSKKEVAS